MGKTGERQKKSTFSPPTPTRSGFLKQTLPLEGVGESDLQAKDTRNLAAKITFIPLHVPPVKIPLPTPSANLLIVLILSSIPRPPFR